MSDKLILLLILIVVVVVIALVVYITKKVMYLNAVKSPSKFAAKVRHGYSKLLNLLLFKSDKAQLKTTIDAIAYNKIDGRYFGGYTKRTTEFDAMSFTLDYFYEIVDYTEHKNETFILSFDNKSKVKELEEKLKLSLGRVGEHMVFPSEAYSLEGAELVTKEVLVEYQKLLKKHNVQMAFIDDNSDSFNVILHSFKKEKEVRKAVELIGLTYHKKLNFIE